MKRKNSGGNSPDPGETPLEEAQILSELSAPALGDEFQTAEYDPDVADMNDPSVTQLGEPPLLGAVRRTSRQYGEDATTIGRATSPKLYASVSQFPTAVQYRVWRMENGVPVGLGTIGTDATEEEFVRAFLSAMPRVGSGSSMYLLRPIDIRGNELGKEITLPISEHHATLTQLREMQRREREEGPGWRRGPGDIIVNSPAGSEVGASYAEEMGRMFEQAVESAEKRSDILQSTLESERERLRVEEKERSDERVSLAERSAGVVEKMTERLMASDRSRADEAIKSQEKHGQLLLTTLTTVFQQQQTASREQAERIRETDGQRMTQDREYFDRQRQDAEDRRVAEREEGERRRREEATEGERRRLEERERLNADIQRMAEQRKYELEALRLESERRERELEVRRQQEKEEATLRLEREKNELARKESADRERWERERQEAERRRVEELKEWERREQTRREELLREMEQRKVDLALQQKQLEMAAQRDREHAERLMEYSRMEREAQRAAELQREKMEREAKDAMEKERDRKYQLQLREMELAREREQEYQKSTREQDREHQERMMQYAKMQTGGGLTGLVDTLGMETPELLARIFGSNGSGGDSSWAETIPKVLTSLAELGTAMANSRPKGPPTQPRLPGVAPVRALPSDELNHFQFQEMERRREPVTIEKPPLTAVSTPRAAPVEATPREVPSVNTTRRANDAGLKLITQKKARKALRILIPKLQAAQSQDWIGLIAAALAEEIGIYHYLRAVTVHAALAEMELDEALVAKIMTELKSAGMIPDDIPFDEADYERLRTTNLLAETKVEEAKKGEEK